MFQNYPQYEYLLAQIQLVCFMLGMGATLIVDDFVQIARQPRSFLVGLAGQLLLAPLLAVLVNRCFDVESGVAVGMILIASMPGGTLSKLFTWFGLGNIALAITLTGAGTLVSLATVPLFLRVLAAEHVPDGFAMPVLEIVGDMLLFLVLPLALGMLIGHKVPARREMFKKWCIRLGLVVVVVMIVGSFGSGRVEPGRHGWGPPLAIICFALLTQQLSMLPFRILGWPKPDCLAVGVEATMRNLNLALLLNARLFPPGESSGEIGEGVLFAILFYAGTALGAGAPLALNFRRRIRRDMLAPASGVSS
jgi:BASS family bile acid:Na+ symporter